MALGLEAGVFVSLLMPLSSLCFAPHCLFSSPTTPCVCGGIWDKRGVRRLGSAVHAVVYMIWSMGGARVPFACSFESGVYLCCAVLWGALPLLSLV